eukprot:3802202-Rhodomonas_salina.1
MTLNTPRGSSEVLDDFASTAWQNTDATSHPLEQPPSLWASTTIEVEPALIDMQHKRQTARRRRKAPIRKNNKPVPWTAEEHE